MSQIGKKFNWLKIIYLLLFFLLELFHNSFPGINQQSHILSGQFYSKHKKHLRPNQNATRILIFVIFLNVQGQKIFRLFTVLFETKCVSILNMSSVLKVE